jgi:YVTN family beta-propeller protein
MAVNPSNRDVYVADFESGAISVLIAGSATYPKTYEIGGAPEGLAFDPSNGYLYVANYYSNNVSVIDPATWSVVGNVTVAAGPTTANDYARYFPDALVYDSSNGDIYASVQGIRGLVTAVGWVSVINGNSNKVVANVTAYPIQQRFDAPGPLEFDPANGCIYTADQSFAGGPPARPPAYDIVTVINGSDNQLLANLKVAPAISGLAFDPNDNYVFAVGGDAELSVIDSMDQTVIANDSIALEAGPAAFNPANGRLYIGFSDGIDLMTPSTALLATISTPGPDVDFVFSDGVLFSSNGGYNTVTEINMGSDTITSTAVLGLEPWKVAVNPSGGDFLVENTYEAPVPVVSLQTKLIAFTLNESEYPTLKMAFDGWVYDPVNGDSYFPSGNSSSVLVADGTNGSQPNIVGRVSVAYQPESIAYDSRSNTFYAFFANQEFQVINATTNLAGKVYAAFTLLGSGANAVYNPSNDCLYVSSSNGVAVINASTNQVLRTIAAGPFTSMVYNGVDRLLFATNAGNGTVTVIAGSTNSVLVTLAVGSGPWGVAVDPGSGDVFVANVGSGTISIVAP